eukprot:CAMPEP_0201738592 /NCGR_PEP_ID=MMETSP0593-20130828/45334_1 /ASSEMBLY_ACC=CAM_ASM_000672 /TAXON_ID=267983 /ORGANISM="Skeletonema japonicum, Strain CCMP2506" /LENGTH=600 /DNA_ID=CAMNT_0048232817 /DNA_START=239 /DNA_END=2041 /DNA_ORIENTATION=-
MRFSTRAFLVLGVSARVSYCQAQGSTPQLSPFRLEKGININSDNRELQLVISEWFAFKNNFNQNYCIDVQNGNAVNGNPVWLYPCNGTPAQAWFVDSLGRIRSKLLDQNYCLEGGKPDENKPTLYVHKCHDGLWQRYTFPDGRILNQAHNLYIGARDGNGSIHQDSLEFEAFSPSTQQQWTYPSPSTAPSPSPSTAPTRQPTAEPTSDPTTVPTNKPTPSPSTAPTRQPTAEPTPGPTIKPTDLPTKSPSDPPTDSPTRASASAIKSWDLELTSVDSNFDKGSADEITLNYKIGKNREYNVLVLTKGCKEEIDEGVIINQTSSISDIEDDSSNSELQVSVDIEKNAIVGSNAWIDEMVKLCVSLQLISGANVMKELKRDIEVYLNFKNEFETEADANFTQISLGSNATSSAVDDYINACTCDGNNEPFQCNTNSLGVNDWLNVCVESLDTEMEIDYLDSLMMVQEGNTLNIVSDKDLVDNSISSKTTRADDSGVHVVSVIPASFFSYESSSTAKVSGVVFLKLSGSRRRLAAAVEIDREFQSQSAGDQQSAFSMEVQLQKNELEVDADSNGAIFAVTTGVIGGASAIVTVASAAFAFMMW